IWIFWTSWPWTPGRTIKVIPPAGRETTFSVNGIRIIWTTRDGIDGLWSGAWYWKRCWSGWRTRSQESGVRSQESGIRPLTPDSRPLTPGSEALFEAAAVLAGTMLMASGICGGSPTAHDSTMTLSKLIPRIARCREAFYDNVLTLVGSAGGPSAEHAERLKQEAARLKQPLGSARQHLNEYLGRHRAAQLQHRHVAMLYAEMGFPEASRQEASKIPAVSLRFVSEIWIRLTTAQRLLSEGQFLASAAKLPAEIEDLIRRGIDCGALPDPWNILGFQGMFPLSAAQEDSIRDPRIDDLINAMEHLFDLYSRLLSEAAGAGERALVKSLTTDMRRLATWWDRFASVEIQDVRRVHGGETVASAEHVAQSMGR